MYLETPSCGVRDENGGSSECDDNDKSFQIENNY